MRNSFPRLMWSMIDLKRNYIDHFRSLNLLCVVCAVSNDCQFTNGKFSWINWAECVDDRTNVSYDPDVFIATIFVVLLSLNKITAPDPTHLIFFVSSEHAWWMWIYTSCEQWSSLDLRTENVQVPNIDIEIFLWYLKNHIIRFEGCWLEMIYCFFSFNFLMYRKALSNLLLYTTDAMHW